MTLRDAPAMARWVRDGRANQVFHGVPSVTAASLLRYQYELKQSKWKYQCLIAEHKGRPIGYLDFCWYKNTGEIRGIYLERGFRQKGLGKHLIRLGVAHLRDAGCKRVTAHVYSDNIGSMHACESVGFVHNRRTTRTEGTRLSVGLVKKISPLYLLGTPNPLYANLKGTNRYFQYLAIAEAIADELKNIDGIELIIGLGSLFRRFADQWSDIDLAVIGRNPDLKRLWRGERWFDGFSIEFFIVDLHRSPAMQWDSERRQAFAEGVVLSSRNSTTLKSICQRILPRREEIEVHARELLLKLGWIGFQPPSWSGHERYGYSWILPYDLWLKRGSLQAAHATVDTANEIILQLIYLLNDSLVPDQKWRRYLVLGLPWLPAHFRSLLRTIETAPRNRMGFDARSTAALRLSRQIFRRAERTGLLRGNAYAAFLKATPEY